MVVVQRRVSVRDGVDISVVSMRVQQCMPGCHFRLTERMVRPIRCRFASIGRVKRFTRLGSEDALGQKKSSPAERSIKTIGPRLIVPIALHQRLAHWSTLLHLNSVEQRHILVVKA